MPFPIELPETFSQKLSQTDDVLTGMWLCSGSRVAAEICAGSGIDWLLIDGEHSPLSLETVQTQLQAIAPYPVTPMVRVPENEYVFIKQYLDLGVQNLLVPMVNTVEEAQSAIDATRYPRPGGTGTRGIGSAFARAARWGRVPDYLARAEETISLTLQIESAEAVENVDDIAALDGVDALFVGPSDLSASMGLIGQQTHEDVIAAAIRVIEAGAKAGKPVGINAFNIDVARRYIDAGARFVLVGSDVTLLARGSEELAKKLK
ncbi:MAG: HpcH/HpaI aldolase/citrate lyase family protein [Actinomycetaceae bacterium]|nr:HpcH/HpaI aldolase/citrate lyase family protein [Actinomycetaceae bacterium]